MHHAPIRRVHLGFAVALALLGSPRAAVQHSQSAPLAADGVTIVDGADRGRQAGAPETSLGASCGSDLIYFEENGGGGGPRGVYDFTSRMGASGLRVAVGGTQRLFALAVQPGTGTVFGVDPVRNDILTVDVNTGAVAFVVSLVGVSTVANISFDPFSGRLFAAERNTMLLYTVDLGTGNVTTIGPLTRVRSGLTFAPDGKLYGVTLNGTLYRIDPLSAAETLIGGGGGPRLAEDGTARADGVLFVTDFDGNIFRVDPTNGTNTLVGNSGSGNGLLGIIPSPSSCRQLPAAETVRLGVPPNPAALLPGSTTGPIIGCTWDPVIDHTTFLPGAVLDILAIGTAPVNVPTPFGTLLCNISLTVTSGVGAPFAIPVPTNCRLVGAALCSQGASTDGIIVAFTNAIDLTIGSF